jgi:two-component system response regulator YesN
MYGILLVDDEALIREAVSENVAWNKYGYQLVGSCENGKEALEFIENHPVDVVLTDICMPYMDGIKLSEVLSEEYPEIKIIILSGYDEFEYAKKAIKFGVSEYLLKPITAQEMGNTLQILKEKMDKEQEDEKKLLSMKANYHKGRVLVQANTMMNLIMGNVTEAEIRRELRKLEIDVDSLSYRVGIVELDIFAKNSKLDEKSKKESALMAFALYNISQEIVKKYNAGEVCQGKDYRTFILFHSNKTVAIQQIIRTCCEEIIFHINKFFQLKINIGIGGNRSDFKEIYQSCEEAEEALGYCYLFNGNQVFEMDNILQKRKQPEVDGIMDHIILHIKENAPEKLRQDLYQLVGEFKECMCDKQIVGTILQRIVDMMGELRKNSNLISDEEAEKRAQMLTRILSAQELEVAADTLEQYCVDTAEEMDHNKNIGGKKYAVLAMDYIGKNYADCNLNLQSICSYLNISPSRFSSIFKNTTGNTFMDAVIGIRMQKSKELLENTDLKNDEIAEKVGFNDPHYFSIAFKKATGKSPTEYSKEMRN